MGAQPCVASAGYGRGAGGAQEDAAKGRHALSGDGEAVQNNHMSSMTTRAARIDSTIRAAFEGAEVTVQDDSAQHAGHAGARPGGETHYTVTVVAPVFRGMSRVARSRAVHEALAGEFAGGLHALALVLRTPEEAGR
jgi:BolA protein